MPPPSPITDDLWLAAHDTVNGKPRLARRTLGIGLGSGLLAELLFTGNIVISQGRILMQPAAAPQDPALSPIINQMKEEERGSRHPYAEDSPTHDIREWITYLALDGLAEELVTARLSQSGAVLRQQKRTLTGKRVYFVPRDPNLAGWPASRISNAVIRRESLAHEDLALAGLFFATGLHQQALEALDQDDLRNLGQQLRSKMHEMLRALIAVAEAAVGEAVMNRTK